LAIEEELVAMAMEVAMAMAGLCEASATKRLVVEESKVDRIDTR